MFIVVAGAGKVGFHLARALVADHEVLIIEIDPSRTAYVSEELGDEIVMQGDACDAATMDRAGMARADLVVAVTGDDDQEKVVVVAECRVSDPASLRALRREIAATVHRVAGVDGEIVLAPPRSLQFTTSGKLSRAAARQSYLDGEIRDVEAGMDIMLPEIISVEPLAAVV